MTYPDPRQHPSGQFQPPTGQFQQPTGQFQQPGYPPTGPVFSAPPPPPPKKGLSTGGIVAIVIGSLVALCCVGGIVLAATTDSPPKKTADEQAVAAGASAGATSAGAKPAATTAAAKTTPAKTPDVAPVGTAVRDGKFEFKVTKGPECGKKQLGSEKAQDQFCLITLIVKNVGNDARTFDDSNQIAYNAAGAKFESDGVAGLYANPNGESFLEKINPGSQITVVIVFDVAASVKLTTLELHDSMFSRGAKVALP